MSPYSLVYKQIIWIINLSCRDWKKEKKIPVGYYSPSQEMNISWH